MDETVGSNPGGIDVSTEWNKARAAVSDDVATAPSRHAVAQRVGIAAQ